MPFRRSYRKSTPKYGRKSTTKRTFRKNHKKGGKIRTTKNVGTAMAEVTKISMPWQQTILLSSITGTTPGFEFWVGNSFQPYIGVTAGTSASAILPAEIAPYATFYRRSIISASSIDMQINVLSDNAGNSSGVFNCVLVPLPYSTNDESLANVITQFSSLNFDSANSLPYARRFIIQCNNANPRSEKRVRSMKSVRSLCDAKNLQDGTGLFDQELSTVHTTYAQPSSGFVWAFGIFPDANGDENTSIQIITKMKLHARFSDRIALSLDVSS